MGGQTLEGGSLWLKPSLICLVMSDKIIRIVPLKQLVQLTHTLGYIKDTKVLKFIEKPWRIKSRVSRTKTIFICTNLQKVPKNSTKYNSPQLVII